MKQKKHNFVIPYQTLTCAVGVGAGLQRGLQAAQAATIVRLWQTLAHAHAHMC